MIGTTGGRTAGDANAKQQVRVNVATRAESAEPRRRAILPSSPSLCVLASFLRPRAADYGSLTDID